MRSSPIYSTGRLAGELRTSVQEAKCLFDLGICDQHDPVDVLGADGERPAGG